MFYLTPQEKAAVLAFCLIIFCGTLIHIGLQKDIRTFDWLHTASKKSFAVAVDINKASIEELLKVPGIGPKTAQFILSYRKLQGGFKDLEPLKEARGMTPARYERLLKYLKVIR